LYRDKKHVKRKIDPEGDATRRQGYVWVGNVILIWKLGTCRRCTHRQPPQRFDRPASGIDTGFAWLVSIGDIRAVFLNGLEAPQQLYLKQPASSLVFNQDN
jgi:hypothetical protein